MVDVNPPTPEEPGSLAWRRRQLLIVSGLVLAVGGLGLYVTAHWGTLCVNESWGEASGSAWPVGLGGAIVAVIGAIIAISGFAVPAPDQVTLVPGGEVQLSGMRVMVTGPDGSAAARLRVGDDEITCRQGDRITVGEYSYDVQAVDGALHWVTLCPVPQGPAEAT